MPRLSHDDDDEHLSRDELRLALAVTWRVERHDLESGHINYEIWAAADPCWRICVIEEEYERHAKAFADKIVADHNEAVTRRSITG